LFEGPISLDDGNLRYNITSSFKIESSLRRKINSIWSERVSSFEKKEFCYDGLSYRLDDYRFTQEKLLLEVSKIRFSVRYSLLKLAEEGTDLDEGAASKGLGVAAFIETSDGYYIFVEKSDAIKPFNKIGLVGGILDFIEANPEIDSYYLFDELCREMKEEISVGNGSVSKYSFLGLVFSCLGGVLILFDLKIDMSKEDVLKNFFENEQAEIECLHFVDKSGLEVFLNGKSDILIVSYDLWKRVQDLS